MKKIFALAIALLAVANIATAQKQAMQVNKTDGTTQEFVIDDVTDVTFGDASWVSIGYGTLYDSFLWDYSHEVEIEQNQLDTKAFRLVWPYREANVAEGWLYEYQIEDDNYYSGSHYLYFNVMSVGDMVNSTTITKENLVFYDPCRTSCYNSSYYGAEIIVYHPSWFSNYQSESYFENSKVTSYQSDGVTPAEVQIAPFHYMDYAGGWNHTGSNSYYLYITLPSVTAGISAKHDTTPVTRGENTRKALVAEDSANCKVEQVLVAAEAK